MAIDPRITLAGVQAPNVGQRFSQALSNLQNIDVLNQRRDLAPIQLQQAQMANELAQAQQPALMQQAELAGSPLAQAGNQLTQEHQAALKVAQAIKPLVDANDFNGALNELTRMNQQMPQLGLADEIELLQRDPKAFADVINSALQASGIGQQQTSLGQQEFENLLRVAQNPNATEIERNAAKIKLGIAPRATGSAGITTATTPGLTERVAGSQAAIAEATKEATEQVVTKETGRRSAVSKAVDYAANANEKISSISELIATYADAVEQLDKGVNTGIIYNMLPSFDVNAMILDNIASEAGFNLAKSGGGIITEADMEWGMRTAIPQNLPPKELKEFLTKKIAAQTKIAENLKNAAMFLGDGDKTLTDWYKVQGKKMKISSMSNDELLKGL